ncbi:MAG: DUF2169 domain-containing protein [Fibrobacterota bacterium]|nr:MAG: DUF2169 domain-containing protein [Fibrobacterota bacterium]
MKWLTRMIPGHMPDGSPIVSVLAKASWSLLPDDLPLQDDPVDWVEADVHWDTNNPATEATQFENELVPWKPCTDVIVIGNAWAPRGKQGKYFDAGIQIGAFRKVVRVFGNRKIVPKTFGFEFSEPELFETMPMHFGKAYGGRFLSSKTQAEMVYPQKPGGHGLSGGSHVGRDLQGQASQPGKSGARPHAGKSGVEVLGPVDEHAHAVGIGVHQPQFPSASHLCGTAPGYRARRGNFTAPDPCRIQRTVGEFSHPRDERRIPLRSTGRPETPVFEGRRRSRAGLLGSRSPHLQVPASRQASCGVDGCRHGARVDGHGAAERDHHQGKQPALHGVARVVPLRRTGIDFRVDQVRHRGGGLTCPSSMANWERRWTPPCRPFCFRAAGA